MKILFASDLHLEFPTNTLPPLPNEDDYDVVVLGGDIAMGMHGVVWALVTFNKPIIYVTGNHEYYHNNIVTLDNAMVERAQMEGDRLHVLAPGSVKIGDITFIGATLWSDLSHPVNDPMFEKSISDFRLIQTGDNERWTAATHRATHRAEKEYIRLCLEDSDTKNTVVITHFLPSELCTHPKFEGSSLNQYFASSCDNMMLDYKPPLWIFGHTHSVIDVTHPSGTRMISNPFGYPNEAGAERKWRIIDTETGQITIPA